MIVKKKKRSILSVVKHVFKLDYITTYIVLFLVGMLCTVGVPSFVSRIGMTRDKIVFLLSVTYLFDSIKSNYSICKLEKKVKSVELEGQIQVRPLYLAIPEVLGSRYRKIHTLRVFALATAVIQPIVSQSLYESGSEVMECKLITHKPTTKEDIDDMNRIFHAWEHDPHIINRNIQHVEFPDILSDYSIIVDEECAILGHYTFDRKNEKIVSYGNAEIVYNTSEQGLQIIKDCIDRFEETYAYFDQLSSSEENVSANSSN